MVDSNLKGIQVGIYTLERTIHIKHRARFRLDYLEPFIHINRKKEHAVRVRWSEVGQSHGQSLWKNIDVRFDDDLSTISRELKVPD